MHFQFKRFASFSCCASWPLLMLLLTFLTAPSSTHAGDEFSVASYNVRYLNKSDGEDVWGNRKSAVIECVAAQDVIGLQEVVEAQLKDIQNGTPMHQWYGVGRDDGKRAGEMTAIGYRTDKFREHAKGTFWLSSTPSKVSKGWDAALPRVASWVELECLDSTTRFILVNTHFDHRGPTARLESAKLLRTWCNEHRTPTKPVILMGDLNASPESPPIKALVDKSEQEPLRDARAQAAKADTGPAGTWNGFKKIEQRRIDHIFTLGNISVLEFSTLDPRTASDRFASDHLPIRAVVSLKNGS